MTKPREKTREELTAEIEEGKKKKSGSLKTGRKSSSRSYPSRNARRETTGFVSAAASWRALCRS